MSLFYELLSNPDHDWALSRFVEQWHGARLDATGAPLLSRVLGAVERHPELSLRNHLYAPYEEGSGLLVFASERDGAYEWALEPVDGPGADPPVWGRWLLDQPDSGQVGASSVSRSGWFPEDERLSGFLVQFLLFEAISGAPWWVQYPAARPGLVTAALGPLRPVLGRWRWPGAEGTFHAADATVAFTCANAEVGDGTVDVTLAARDAADLDHLAGLSADGWLVRGPGGSPDTADVLPPGR